MSHIIIIIIIIITEDVNLLAGFAYFLGV